MPARAFSIVAMTLIGCGTVARSSLVRTGASHAAVATTSVRLCMLSVPEGAEELGLVEAHSGPESTFESIAHEFKAQVAKAGGDVAKVDKIRTKFEMVSNTYTYQCGKSTCVGTNTIEVPTTTWLGHAYRTRSTQ